MEKDCISMLRLVLKNREKWGRGFYLDAIRANSPGFLNQSGPMERYRYFIREACIILGMNPKLP